MSTTADLFEASRISMSSSKFIKKSANLIWNMTLAVTLLLSEANVFIESVNKWIK